MTEKDGCFFQKNVSSFRKRAHVFSLEKEHTKESRVEKSSREHTKDRFCFLRRAAETERAVEKEQFFHSRKRTRKRAESKSLLGNTRQTLTEEKFCFFQKNVFILVVTNIKQSSLCSSSALCAETHFRVQTLSARALFAFRGGVCCRRCF